MKIPSLLVALLVSASATVNAESTCSEESGVCICSGSCPSFTSSWGSSTLFGGNCIANKNGDNNITLGGNFPPSDGEVLMVNDIKYTYPFDACPASNGGGDAVPDDTTTDDKEDPVSATVTPVPDDDTTTDTIDNNNSGTTIINGVTGTLEFTTDKCEFGTKVQCAVASGPLCKNNMCAGTTSTCNDAGDGCLDLMGNPEACNEPANVCGDGYCGTPPVFENCRCKDNQCYAMKFVPSDGSAPTMEDTKANSSPIMVGSWLVAVLAAVVGW